MPQRNNLAGEMESQLPARMVEFMQQAGLVAAGQSENLYLVGGVVRDLLLKRPKLDVDLVVRGDAIALAKKLAGVTNAKLTIHPRFGTSTLTWDTWQVDIATSRSEHYDRPGALPTVHAGPLDMDMFRRDFTINAMAIELSPKDWGNVIDYYGGRADLEKGWLRILHEDSFIDDATRILRGLRYEQRLDFKFEPKTLKLLKRDARMIQTISGDRIRHELERILVEEQPEKVILRATKLNVLPEIHPALQGDAWLARKFRQARQAKTELSLKEIYLALIAYRLSASELEKLISHLKLNKFGTRILLESYAIKSKLDSLAVPELSPSGIYNMLHGFNNLALFTNLTATDSQPVKRRIGQFLTKLKDVKPSLTGTDLQKLGIDPGPQMKEMLHRLLEARLNGEVKNKKEELEIVEQWIA